MNLEVKWWLPNETNETNETKKMSLGKLHKCRDSNKSVKKSMGSCFFHDSIFST